MEKIATIKKKWFIDQVDLLNKAGMTKTEIAYRLNIKPQSLNNVLSRDQSVSDNLLDKFIAVFDVRDFDLLPSKAPEQPLGIPLLPYEAVAGYGVMNYTDLRAEDFYVVSELRGADFLLRIKGDSMTPKFNGGDIVACRKIELSPEDPRLEQYLHGAEIEADGENGWAVVMTQGCALGGAKIVNGRAKNHYPKGLRKV